MGRRIRPEKYGGGRKPVSFGLNAFMGVELKACFDDAKFAPTSHGDMFNGFLNDGESSGSLEEDAGDDDNDEDVSVSVEEKAAYWKKQQQLLEAALQRNSFFEESVRRDIEGALLDARSSPVCICKKPATTGGCPVCLQRHVVGRLREAGQDATICRSKWRSSPDMPAGEHSYIDVINTASGLNEFTAERVVVELDFRAEFEMARGSSDYNQLVARLPEVFVGKPNRLKEVIKVVCSAGKRCMKEKKMHLGPWRRQKYMHAKWLSTYERMEPPQLLPMQILEQHKEEFDVEKDLKLCCCWSDINDDHDEIKQAQKA